MNGRIAVFAALVVAATACAGSDGASENGSESEVDSSAGASDTAGSGVDATATDDADTDGSGTAGSGTDGSGTDGSGTDGSEAADAPVPEFCDAIRAIGTAEFELEETFGPEARALFENVQRSAPPEIADDVEIVIAALDEVAELGLSTEEDDPEATDAALEILFDPSFVEANDDLATFTAQECGLDLAGSEDVDTPTELDDPDE